MTALPTSPARRRSLRWRLAWTFTLLTILVVMAQALALFLSSEEQEEELIDEVVNTALDGVIGPHARDVPLPSHLSLYHAPLGTLPRGLPAGMETLALGNHEWFIGGVEYHVGVRDGSGERYYLLYDTREHEERLERLLTALVVGVAVLSAMALWLGQWLADTQLRQLKGLAARVARDDAAPFTEPEQDEEVASLALALDDYRARNAALIAREREFTANVSHELRTPLTRIRTSAELLAETTPDRERAQRIVLAVDELERRLRGLLFLARGNTPLRLETVALYPLVESLAEQYRDACTRQGLSLLNLVHPEASVEADPAVLSLILDNLLSNAVRYAGAGQISIHTGAGWVAVRDTGVGIPADQLAQVFERHYRISDLPDGSGLGLSIVRQLAERCGWRCELSSEPGTGTESRLVFAG
ncbi:sensor histidine kinase [Chitiniphilus eburneus]|uniref:histidine kinase n=1 Tax=Chitiniphilus eburneus TaxID=2571148 RepID=A0A4U0QRG1_9NEIS|nr:HAMP domain-containing sensor histidine kinase [Chitiniphilus eburneus]TJZ78814.1 HAMP domain-containing histidine kinase [Chitiniphilus eburneus]